MVDAAAYPEEWELDALLRDGTPVHVRPIRPDDKDALIAFHSRLSPDTIYRRFFSPRPVLPPKDVERFTNVDYRDRLALIAVIGGEMAGVARYDRDTGGGNPTEAEVAFVIEDRHQGRGLGSLLLEHLAAAARERGISAFVAETLAENRAMLGVFRDAGFVAERRFEDGLVHLRFPIAETPEAMEAMAERERRSSVQSMTPLLRPRSVAVIGASRRPGSMGHALLRNLVAHEFAGPVFPVHPEAASIAGVPAHRSLEAVPGEVDLAVVTVPAAEVPAVVEACGRKGVRAVVVISAGFAETGAPDAQAAEADLVRTARRHGMRLVGPNAMGVVSTVPEVSLMATFSQVQPAPGRVALLSQSGFLGLAVLQQAIAHGIGFSSFVSVGNRADVSGNDLLQYWEADPETDVVLLYLETFGNPRKFARIARRVTRSKPVVVVKSGRGLGDDQAFEALFRQAGVIRVDTVAELFDVTLVLAHQPIPAGARLAVVGDERGAGILAADAAAANGVPLAARVGLAPGAGPEDYAAALSGALADPAVDAALVIGVSVEDEADELARAIAAASATRPDKPVLASFPGGVASPGVVAGTEGELHPIPVFPFPEQAVRAFARAAAYSAWRNAPESAPVRPDGVDVVAARSVATGALTGDGGRWLDDVEVRSLLAPIGVSLDDSPTPPGAVEVRVEVVDDPSFGPLLSLSMGGPVAELLEERVSRFAPLSTRDAEELVRSGRLSPLLFGHHGAPSVDEGRLLDLLHRVSALADGVPEVASLTLSPVWAAPAGVIVGGARVRVERPPVGPGPLLRRLR